MALDVTILFAQKIKDKNRTFKNIFLFKYELQGDLQGRQTFKSLNFSMAVLVLIFFHLLTKFWK